MLSMVDPLNLYSLSVYAQHNLRIRPTTSWRPWPTSIITTKKNREVIYNDYTLMYIHCISKSQSKIHQSFRKKRVLEAYNRARSLLCIYLKINGKRFRFHNNIYNNDASQCPSKIQTFFLHEYIYGMSCGVVVAWSQIYFIFTLYVNGIPMMRSFITHICYRTWTTTSVSI